MANKDYATLYDAALKTYTQSVPAAGLFWKRFTGTTIYGLRIEAPSIMKEFSDGVAFGTDPEGTLFFFNLSDLNEAPGHSKYKLTTYFKDNKRTIVVQIYRHSPEKPYAEFIAKDPNQTVDYNIDDKPGKWASNITQGSANAHVQKKPLSQKVTITIPAIRKKATFFINRDTDKHISVDVWGNVMFKDIIHLGAGGADSSADSSADYNKDRIIIYPTPPDPKTGTSDFSALFIPTESAPAGALGNFSIDKNLVSFEVEGVTWSDIKA